MRLLRFAGRCARLAWAFLTAVVPSLAIDAVGIAGAAAISYGTWEVYRPAGIIVAGILMLMFALVMARRAQ